jgi:hypothetical protein
VTKLQAAHQKIKVQFLARARDLLVSSPKPPDWLCGPTNLVFNAYDSAFSRDKAAGA